MAEALWQAYGRQTSGGFAFYEPNPERQSEIKTMYKATAHNTIHALIAASDTVFLCIKPQTLPSIMPELASADWQNKILVSILAGIPMSRFASLSPNLAIARAMPNTPLQVGEGFSGICFQNSSTAQEAQVMAIFAAGGSVVKTAESTLNAITGISGSGPAFFYKLAQAVVAIGSTHGLSEADTRRCIAQTMIGAGKMMLAQDTPLQTLMDQVTSPGGTTAAGLAQMELAGVDQAFGDVILKAIIRAEELSRPSP